MAAAEGVAEAAAAAAAAAAAESGKNENSDLAKSFGGGAAGSSRARQDLHQLRCGAGVSLPVAGGQSRGGGLSQGYELIIFESTSQQAENLRFSLLSIRLSSPDYL